jgi:hypothetical protein
MLTAMTTTTTPQRSAARGRKPSSLASLSFSYVGGLAVVLVAFLVASDRAGGASHVHAFSSSSLSPGSRTTTTTTIGRTAPCRPCPLVAKLSDCHNDERDRGSRRRKRDVYVTPCAVGVNGPIRHHPHVRSNLLCCLQFFAAGFGSGEAPRSGAGFGRWRIGSSGNNNTSGSNSTGCRRRPLPPKVTTRTTTTET